MLDLGAMAKSSFAVDMQDPRAPSVEEWARMSESERAWVVEQLPSELPRTTLPEGDGHREPKEKALEALREYYRRLRRRVYLSAELPIYYPAERVFAPDVIAVLDVEPHSRQRWVVLHEGKGLDFALEITLEGDRRKDLNENVERYARLGIPEYFVLDLKLKRILGYRLAAAAGYEPIVPQAGRWSSMVLGLDLAFEKDRVRFYAGSAPLPHSEELVARLDQMVEELVEKEERLARELEEAQARAEEQKARAEEQKARAEEQEARADRLAERLRRLGVDPDQD